MSGGELFHYTTGDGLKGILQDHDFRITHYVHLNDASEMVLLKPNLDELFRKELSGLILNDQQRCGKLEKAVQREHAINEADSIFDLALAEVDRLSPIFVGSFCNHQENHYANMHGLLSQWRGYGFGGGYCIVFDKDRLIALFDEFEDRLRFSSMQHGLVKYLTSDPKVDLSKLDGLASALYKSKFNSLSKKAIPKNNLVNWLRYDNVSADLHTELLLRMVLEEMPFYKHEAFLEEGEYRIAAAALTQSAVNPAGRTPAYEFRVRSNEIVPFVKLFGKKVELPINRIIVGPGGDPRKRVHGAGQLARSCGLNIEVSQSEIPFS